MATKSITEQFNEAVQKIQALEGDLSQNTSALGEAEKTIKAFGLEKTTLTSQIETLTAQAKDALAQASKVNAELVETKAMVAKLQEEAKTATQKAGELLGNVGTPAIGTTVIEPVATTEELWKQYKALSDSKDRNNFYAKHRQQLLQPQPVGQRK